MKQILFINACVRPESRTKRLAQAVLETKAGTITQINLEKENIMPLNNLHLQVREEAIKSGDFSSPDFRYAKQFAEADELVIAAPYWDLSFPATLKIYLEAVAVNNITFCYTNKGVPKGLCKCAKLTYVTTAGGTIGDNDFGFLYVKALFQNMFSINEVVSIKAENLDILGSDPEEILKNAQKTII
ncbi:MAG: NAD(P)H-dependent oxidoreductase [Oscillospiraceae bacterium]